MLVLFLIGAAPNVDPDIFLVGVAKVVIYLFLGCVNGIVKCPLTKHFDIFLFFLADLYHIFQCVINFVERKKKIITKRTSFISFSYIYLIFY